MSIFAIEILAAICGVLGTVLLAMRGPRAGWGFVAYLGSNTAWLTSSWLQGQWPLFVQQLAFLASSVLGIWCWLVLPLAPTFRAVYRTSRPYHGRFLSARLALKCAIATA